MRRSWVSRPPVTAIIRLNYPATHRGSATGKIRQWYLLSLLAASAISAWTLDLARDSQRLMIQGQMALAGLASALAFMVFRTIRVSEDGGLRDRTNGTDGTIIRDFSEPFIEAWRILRKDRRFRIYLAIGFLYSFGGLLYVSYVPVLFSRRLALGYLASSVLTNTLPTLLSVFSTGCLGVWMDRINTWKSWAAIRLGWGADPLLLAGSSVLAAIHPHWAAALAALARTSRGLVMGGSWILWWQVGVNHFAKPGGDTTRYLGLVLFVNGFARLLGPSAGAWLLRGGFSLGTIFTIGGILVILSSCLSWIQYLGERNDLRLSSMAAFEASQSSSHRGLSEERNSKPAPALNEF